MPGLFQPALVAKVQRNCGAPLPSLEPCPIRLPFLRRQRYRDRQHSNGQTDEFDTVTINLAALTISCVPQSGTFTAGASYSATCSATGGIRLHLVFFQPAHLAEIQRNYSAAITLSGTVPAAPPLLTALPSPRPTAPLRPTRPIRRQSPSTCCQRRSSVAIPRRPVDGGDLTQPLVPFPAVCRATRFP